MTKNLNVLIAVDKFKGSLTGIELSSAIAKGLCESLGNSYSPMTCPIADGGDGTVDVALSAGYQEVTTTVCGPLKEKVRARFAYDLSTATAVIEVAEACGLRRIPANELNTWDATSFGVGELILAALKQGARNIVLGLGGSATTDGGAGMLQALGAQILDAQGNPVAHGGGALGNVETVDLSTLDSRLGVVNFSTACDVRNPLLGQNGAAVVYGPQKGATAEQVKMLDAHLKHFSNLLELNLNVSRETFSGQPGAGAAGGLGFACFVLGATMRPGVELCFELTGFYRKLENADVVITGEGKLDRQTLQGKGPAGVASAARARNKPVFAVCGSNELSEREAQEAGFAQVCAVLDLGISLEESLANPVPYVEILGRTLGEAIT
ncbi:MAG: glycerate kinase [Rothia sp. (in: high G+C Gram-positive bacteria)]|nr:glycerate kinase [Rothia sp. (in: high G+C Gram-positive bacteria)]